MSITVGGPPPHKASALTTILPVENGLKKKNVFKTVQDLHQKKNFFFFRKFKIFIYKIFSSSCMVFFFIFRFMKMKDSKGFKKGVKNVLGLIPKLVACWLLMPSDKACQEPVTLSPSLPGKQCNL